MVGVTYTPMSLATVQDGFVIGVDAGGTHTRVGCFGRDGTRLSFATGGGGSPTHNDDAQENVRATITRALESGGLLPEDATALVAGMAGLNRSSSNQGDGRNDWAARFVDVDGLKCPKIAVNDAVIAHRGALSGRAGIVVVAGTGSMILAIAPDGTETESGQFLHYAGAARHLVHDVVQRILIGETTPNDPLLAAVLTHFGAADTAGLRNRVLANGASDRNAAKRNYGALAPRVTSLAGASRLADVALRDLAARTARGVRLLAPLAGEEFVPVACTGSLAADPAFRDRLEQALHENGPRTVELVGARLDPLGGAAVLALETAGAGPDQAVIDRLSMAEYAAI